MKTKFKNKRAEEEGSGWWTIILWLVLIASFLIAAYGVYMLIGKLTG